MSKGWSLISVMPQGVEQSGDSLVPHADVVTAPLSNAVASKGDERSAGRGEEKQRSVYYSHAVWR
jgi:hypothetical protein